MKESIFDNVADVYSSARPPYPDSLLKDLAKESGLTTKSRILEIGVGTGMLTIELAKMGFNVIDIELGSKLAGKARQNLSRFPGVQILNGNFDACDFGPETFDLSVAATSYHWLGPERRSAKIGDLLRPGGIMAIIETRHVDMGKDTFPAASQKCYLKWDENATEDYRIPTSEEVANAGNRYKSEFQDKFEEVVSRTYESDLPYNSRDYVNLLATYFDVIAMEESCRDGLLDYIGNLIDSEYGGKITKSYFWQLFLEKKL